ncbi:pentapeptide repeat-containing protein [Pigmentibacter sp. JX0631]|uniref:pentapeptide repeat-containing protein n=1 Tax=Pigmentibacter sp. JX0631 TaxID=2976982 RepID=UPI0024696F6F|nr:pentapeptide repeat-containing protein [Pigmentibacter sp. JX0631]WGL60468.1 pentapeptide repeat-containing protein [Pigmentibacter sp. JX0631]
MRKMLAFSLMSVSLNSYSLTIEDVTDQYSQSNYGNSQTINSEVNNDANKNEYIQLQENEKTEIMNSLRYFYSNSEFDKVLSNLINTYSYDQRKIDLNFYVDNRIISGFHKKGLIHYITEFKENSFEYLQILQKFQNKYDVNLIAEDYYGNTPLFNVSNRNDYKSAKFLLEYTEVKNKMNSPLNHLKHPLYAAERFQDKNLANLLIQNGAVNNYPKYGYSNTSYTNSSNNQNTKVENDIKIDEKNCAQIYEIDNNGQLYFTQEAQDKLFSSAEKGDLKTFRSDLASYYKAMDYVHTAFKVLQFLPPNLAFNYKNSSTLFHLAFNTSDKNLLRILLSYKDLFNFDFNIKDKQDHSGISVYEKVDKSSNTVLKNEFNHAFYSSKYSTLNSNYPAYKSDSFPSYTTNYGVNFSNTESTSYSNKNYNLKSGYSNKNLENSNFTSRVFYKEKFVKANLKGANFKSATLIETDFTGADLTDADFTDADLSRANFTGANLSGANFTNSFVYYTDFTKVILSNKTKLPSSEGIILREKEVVFNDNKVHKFAPASQFFNLSNNLNNSMNSLQTDFEKDLEKSTNEQKKKKEQENSKKSNAQENYSTPNLEDLRKKRLDFYGKNSK